MRTRTASLLWVTDADNTLWDTDALFARAQLSLLEEMELASGRRLETDDRLGFVREVDQAIAIKHHKGLRYSADLLAFGIWERLAGRTLVELVRSALTGAAINSVQRIASDKFASHLNEMPALRDGVIEGLAALQDRQADIVVATEGSKSRIERTLEHHNLADFVRMCLEAPKHPDLFRRLAAASGRSESWMIGDQLDRDIAPAQAAGYSTAYFAGTFTPSWHRGEDAHLATVSVRSYLEGALAACFDSLNQFASKHNHRTHQH